MIPATTADSIRRLAFGFWTASLCAKHAADALNALAPALMNAQTRQRISNLQASGVIGDGLVR